MSESESVALEAVASQRPSTPRSAVFQYAAQRRLGFAWLRFAPALEREFREGFFATNAVRVRLASLLGFCGVLGFLVLDAGVQALMPPAAQWLLAYVALPACGLSFALGYVRHPGMATQQLLAVCTAVVGVAIVGCVLVSRQANYWFPWASVLLVTLYCYHLAGLLFRQAVVCALTIGIAYLVGRERVEPGPLSPHYELFYLLMANAIGWVGLYFFEYQQRLSFLLERELGQRAQLDGLTGVLNRASIRKHLNLMWRQAQRDGRSVGLLLVDIDYFKGINDARGHLAGDACLRAVAGVLVELTRRPLDAVGRLGGDEFLIAWYDTDGAGFEHLRQMLLQRVAQLPAPGGGVPLQVSGGGVVAWPSAERKLVAALQLADAKLYEAKRNGRGSVLSVVLPGGTPAGPGRAAQ